jgi:hypothetical protein
MKSLSDSVAYSLDNYVWASVWADAYKSTNAAVWDAVDRSVGIAVFNNTDDCITSFMHEKFV